jgi:branched-chain amino acid aminotransferase
MAATDAPDRRIWIDGSLVPWQDATVHLLSHSLQRGSLVFDYMSVHATERGAAVFRLGDHVRRFLASCELVGLPLARSLDEVSRAIVETVRANPGSTAVKVCAYLPSVEVDVVPLDARVSLAVASYDPGLDIVARKTGAKPAYAPTLRIWLEKQRRNRRPDILSPHAKVAANYAGPMIAKWAAKKRGYDEILLLDEEGYLAEGPTTNFFLVDREGTLRTPPEETVLLGVTRRSILDIAVAEGRKVVEEKFRPEALFAAAEAFITGTTAGVWPIASVDDHPLPAAPGPVSLALRERFERVVSGRDPAFERWLTYVGGAGA